MWHPGRRLLLYSMKPAVNTVVLWLFSSSSLALGEVRPGREKGLDLSQRKKPGYIEEGRWLFSALFSQVTATILGTYTHLPGVI